jgi:hypothetical protein
VALANQWRMVSGPGGSGYLGLNFPSIPEALEMAGVVKKKQQRRVRQNLRYMEGEALSVLNGVDEDEQRQDL